MGGSRFECDALVLAADDSALEVLAALHRRGPSTWSLLIVSQPGDALRQVIRRRPKLLLVCIAATRLEAGAALLAELSHRRRGSSDAPIVALTAAHEEAIERAARTAGATYYLALDSRTDQRLLDHLLKNLGIPPPDTVAPPPPPARAPPAQALSPPAVSTRRQRD